MIFFSSSNTHAQSKREIRLHYNNFDEQDKTLVDVWFTSSKFSEDLDVM